MATCDMCQVVCVVWVTKNSQSNYYMFWVPFVLGVSLILTFESHVWKVKLFCLIRADVVCHTVILCCLCFRLPNIDNVYQLIICFICAEYRTVSGVAGPLVILDKVKVCVVFSNTVLNTLQTFISSFC